MKLSSEAVLFGTAGILIALMCVFVWGVCVGREQATKHEHGKALKVDAGRYEADEKTGLPVFVYGVPKGGEK